MQQLREQPRLHRTNRYSKQKIERLLHSHLLRQIFDAFVRGILKAPDEIKLKVFNLTTIWPEDGNEAMHEILRLDSIQDLLEETDRDTKPRETSLRATKFSLVDDVVFDWYEQRSPVVSLEDSDDELGYLE
jgi:hypothetical protein